MKFYNPFKPHIVQNKLGQYLIRAYKFEECFFGWSYMDRQDFMWWDRFKQIDDYCTMTKGEAKSVMEHYTKFLENREKKEKRKKDMKKTSYVEL